MQVQARRQLYETSTNSGIVRFLGPQNPAMMKKVIRSLIMEPDNLFHVTVNPPPSLPIGGGPTLCELYLFEQYKHCVKLFKFFLNTIISMCEDFMFVPERTKEGVIHFHCIIKLVKGRIYTDLKRMMWDIFNISELPDMQKKSAIKSMVHITPIKDESIIDYLFNKDKKDYETIYTHKGVNDTFLFECQALQEVPACAEGKKKLVIDEGTTDDEVNLSEESPSDPQPKQKKRTVIVKKKK